MSILEVHRQVGTLYTGSDAAGGERSARKRQRQAAHAESPPTAQQSHKRTRRSRGRRREVTTAPDT